MHICTSWLIQAYVRAGQREEAGELLRGMLLATGRTGLLPEQYDPSSARGLGNHPQAYSHLGIINAVLDLDGSVSLPPLQASAISPPRTPVGDD